jgi:hypothetical protein
MEKHVSYFDWELKFKKKSTNKDHHAIQSKDINTLGISSSEFRSFLKEWTVKNLPDKK